MGPPAEAKTAIFAFIFITVKKIHIYDVQAKKPYSMDLVYGRE